MGSSVMRYHHLMIDKKKKPKRTIVETVSGVYVEMIFDTARYENMIVSTYVGKDGDSLADCILYGKRFDYAIFPSENLDEIVAEFDRQMDFSIGMFGQTRTVKVGKNSKVSVETVFRPDS